MNQAMESLSINALNFAARYGTAINQISDTMFFLASAGRSTVQVNREFAEAQKLVIATAKDLTASLQDNKEVVEVYAGLMNIYRDANESVAQTQERAAHTAAILFEAFKTQQILISELAAGLQYSSAQAKAMGVSIEQLVATLAVLNTGMIKGSKAGTSLANAMRDTVKRADKLREVLDIDVTGIGKDFDFIGQVIKPIAAEIDRAGVSISLFTKLFEVYNIRATRAIIGLAVQYDKLTKLMGDFDHAQEDLKAALDTVTSSMKAQESRTQQLKTMLMGMIALALTGGQPGGQGVGRACGDRSARASDQIRVPRGQDPCDQGIGFEGFRGRCRRGEGYRRPAQGGRRAHSRAQTRLGQAVFDGG